MAKKYDDQEFIENVVTALVNNPDDVETTRKVDEMGVLVTLKVNPEDMGIIIGRGGQNARAIRTLVRVVGAKNNAHVNLRIEEPEGSTKGASKSASKESKKASDKKKSSKTSKDVDKAVEDLDL